jgi:methylenetetrahydrofolate dehydrogenase (NADP+) / methenyltetrahydrofolate cyclohydrolase
MTPSNTTALRLDGNICAASVLEHLTHETTLIRQAYGVAPKLAVIQVGQDPASSIYVNKKHRMAEQVGMQSIVLRLPEGITQTELLETLATLNADASVNGILVQLPLPLQLNSHAILEAISPEKDVDGFHPLNVGRLYSGLSPYALPCTPAGVMTLLKHYNISVAGKNAVVLGRSNIVGKPMAQLLLQADATVTLCHSRSLNVEHYLKLADIVVSAVGKPNVLKGSNLKPGCIVLDVGINRCEVTGKLVGDVDYESVSRVASAVTPVPGGVGPMTIATLLENTLRLFELQHSGV